jgi:hypothetical protein
MHKFCAHYNAVQTVVYGGSSSGPADKLARQVSLRTRRLQLKRLTSAPLCQARQMPAACYTKQ